LDGDAADFDLGPAEVDQQAQRLAGGAQIVPTLRDVQVAQPSNHLKFNDNLVLDQKIGGLFANDHVVVKDDDTPLLNDTQPAFSHLVGQGILIDLFNKPGTQCIGNPERTPNDPLGHRLQQLAIPLIHLHPSDPP
jgi:hypothetical protein